MGNGGGPKRMNIATGGGVVGYRRLNLDFKTNGNNIMNEGL